VLKTYQLENGGLRGTEIPEGAPVPPESLWIDLLDPTAAERNAVNALLGMELPTRADMEEIEISSRLYSEDGGVFMTALILSQADSERPYADVVTFVLARERLITIRFIDPQPFRTFAARCERALPTVPKAEGVLHSLLDVIVDRMADVLERVGAEVESISREIFDPLNIHTGRRDFQTILRRLGAKHDMTAKMRECLLTLDRMATFMAAAIDAKASKETRAHVKTLSRDAQSLLDHSSFIAGKLSYLQDATLGLINNEQNNIIKIMSVAAMVFLPPTLIASIYGMNFHYMPELQWPAGYFLSLLLMIVSAIVPYLWFKRRGWL
jgi:magnesium transporter